ncbi:MAG: class I SAM-dependent methyltransferase [Bacteroidota bacterium]
MSNIYNDSTYLSNNPTWHEEDAQFKSDKILQILNRNHINYKTVCEIGCGSGEILVQLASKLDEQIHFCGFDISKDAIEIAEKKQTDRLKFELKDITDENDSQFFDLVLVIDVIEHIDNYFIFLEKISSKGKYTLFHIPLDLCLWTLFREKMLIESKERVGHIHNFTEEFIISILNDKGFSVIDKMYTEPISVPTSFKQKIIDLLRKTLYKINKRFCTKTIGGYSLLVLTENKIDKV